MANDESATETLIDERVEGENRVLRAKALSVPESSKYPEGVKYRFHYGTLGDETILRYDNSHGIHEHPGTLPTVRGRDRRVVSLLVARTPSTGENRNDSTY